MFFSLKPTSWGGGLLYTMYNAIQVVPGLGGLPQNKKGYHGTPYLLGWVGKTLKVVQLQLRTHSTISFLSIKVHIQTQALFRGHVE